MRTIWTILVEYQMPDRTMRRKNYVMSDTMQITALERHLKRVNGKILHRVVMPVMTFDDVMEDIDGEMYCLEMLV
jgi:hypothetical protein